MSPHEPSAAAPASLPDPGYYPVPDHHRKRVVERNWDGDVWTDEVRPAADGATLPGYKRHLFRFLRSPGWKLLVGYVVFAAIAAALWSSDREDSLVGGIQLAMPLFAGLAALMVMLALFHFLNGRVALDRIAGDTRKSIVKWGVLSGVIGIAFAVGVETFVPEIFGESIKDDHGWALIAGPAEETGKLILPLILWAKGFYRRPVEGYLLVLVSAAVFGIAEATEYGAQPDKYQVTRPAAEIMHPLFTGFIAAVAWPAAWRAKRMFTRALFGSWLVAVLVHSINDVIVLDKELADVSKLTGCVTLVAIVLMYLLQKHAARRMVPPDLVGEVSPHWRPAAPRR